MLIRLLAGETLTEAAKRLGITRYTYSPCDTDLIGPADAGITVLNSSDGSTASYYTLPPGCTELQDLISHKDMNAQLGEIFRAAYRFGECPHSDKLREAKKIKFYAEAEIARLNKGK